MAFSAYDYEEDPYPKERSRARVVFDHKKGLYICSPSAQVLDLLDASHYIGDAPERAKKLVDHIRQAIKQ